MTEESVLVIGGGIAGLTAAALLAYEGIPVTLLESHHQPGGCAGTFRRGSYVFDVGATQVAGMERGGIHERLFRHLKLPPPSAEILDPGCLVDLGDGTDPISLWHDPNRWEDERKRQFPGTEAFWSLCAALHKNNWEFVAKDPVLPIRELWDFWQLFKAFSPATFFSSLFSTLSIGDLLRLTGCANDQRLKQFLDLQLRLYSQEPADRTAALYGATVMHMSQAPLGLWHLQGSMQKLSDHLVSCVVRYGGRLLLKHKVVGLKVGQIGQALNIQAINANGQEVYFKSMDVVCSLPPQCLLKLMPLGSGMPKNYQKHLENLPHPQGALVLYGAIERNALPENCPSHIQIAAEDPGSIFLSISRDGDGRAPIGEATLIASVFAETNDWCSLAESSYQRRKQIVESKIVQIINGWLGIAAQHWLHRELATPRSFAKWTGRPEGIVGGLGQSQFRFGPFGLSSRTPISGLWLCGDSIHPGEGTAGVSQSALMACRQLVAKRGGQINFAS